MLFRKNRSVGLRENLKQRNLEGREGKRSIETVTAPFPLAGDAGMAEQEGCHQIGLVAIGGGIVTVPGKVAEQSFGHFCVQVGGHAKPQDGRRYRHVEQLDPNFHVGQSAADVFRALDRLRRQFCGRRDLSPEVVTHQALVKALDSRQQSQFPFRILGQTDSFGCKVPTCLLKGLALVKPKPEWDAIVTVVTEVTRPVGVASLGLRASGFEQARTPWRKRPASYQSIGSQAAEKVQV